MVTTEQARAGGLASKRRNPHWSMACEPGSLMHRAMSDKALKARLDAAQRAYTADISEKERQLRKITRDRGARSPWLS